MSNTTCYAVRLTSLNNDTWETVLTDVSRSEAVAYANAYNAASGDRAACVVAYPASGDPATEGRFVSNAALEVDAADHEPTPAEIYFRVMQIQSNWDEATRYKRFHAVEADSEPRGSWMPPMVDELLLLAIDAD